PPVVWSVPSPACVHKSTLFLLSLLSAMYRDEELHLDMLEGAEGAQAKVLIYERTLDWVLTKQRAEGYRREHQAQDSITARDLNPDITELAPDHLRRILQEAGLCVVQSGMEFASIRAIEDRLIQDSAAKAFLEAAQKRLNTDDTPLRNALAAFYLQEGRQGEGSIEFVHKSFGEFLCAERIVNGLIDVCQPGRNREYDIDDPAFFWLMYDLLGCHVLTPEIVEYLTALLTKHPEFKPLKLHQRLMIFFLSWNKGDFINAPPENHPQTKMRILHKTLDRHDKPIGQVQIDLYTGLNALIILFELHRYELLSLKDINHNKHEFSEESRNSKLTFNPCGEPFSDQFDPDRLLRIFDIGHSLKIKSFSYRINPFLSHVDFHHANLRRSNLYNANLKGACLRSCDFELAFLAGSKLTGADLSKSILTRANLEKSDLRYANLTGCNLTGASLAGSNAENADFTNTELVRCNLESARLTSVSLKQSNARLSKLSDSKINKANLTRVDFSSADLTRANLESSILSGSNLNGANLFCADLYNAKLLITDLTRSNLFKVNFTIANLRQADLRQADLRFANLSFADFCQASLINCCVAGANLVGAIFMNADLSNTDFSEAIFSDEHTTIQWNEKTIWEGVKGLESAIGVPEALKRQLGLE
ncbi:MAG: pentapeptide repeat-containing protein, partial [Cyanobacteria bacterium P01_D01_bin.128]